MTKGNANSFSGLFAQIARLRLINVLSVILLILTGCSAMESLHESPDYYRHSLSQLSKPMEGGDFYWFDVKLTPEYPGASDAAEAARMDWLSTWLESRKACTNGYEIVERREFDFLEHNPAQYDLRYKVQCVPPPVAAS